MRWSGARNADIPPDRLRQFFAEAMVVPVLTAHPTEVRRKSMIDREMEVAELLAERDRYPLTDGGAGRQRGGAAPRDPDPVADQSVAPHPAAGHRRGQ